MDLQKAVQETLDRAVRESGENSLQFCVYKDGECIVDAWAGFMDFRQSRPIDGDTLFPVYSTTKGVPATALNRLIWQGKISEDIPVREIWPEFAQNGKENTLVRHLLNHSSGLPQRLPAESSYEAICDWKHMIKAIEECAPDWEPGTKTRYQSLTFGWVTAELVQRVTGMSFKEYIEQELFAPSGINDFKIGMDDRSELKAAEFQMAPDCPRSSSATACDPLDELMRQKCIRRAVLPGFNGFASARALAAFYDAVLHEKFFPREILDRATAMCRPEPEPPTMGSWNTFGNGYALSGPVDDVGRIFGHGGYGGSDGLADKKGNMTFGFTCGVIGSHQVKEELFQLAGLIQRENWLPQA